MNEKYFWPWFAGFWEGEGCLYVNEKRRTVFFSVSQTDKFPIEFIHKKLGGRIVLRKSNNPRHRDSWVWVETKTKRVSEILEALIDFLVFRKEEVIKKLDVIRSMNKYNKFTQTEDLFIRENWQVMSDKEIARVLGRSISSILHRRTRLGLKKPPIPGDIRFKIKKEVIT